ncbi:hypothetical protein B0H14DRAFT_3861865 [Mycena olivaceomarginata]|nr:hypothetical protein B0H14DRAFT_3861865 [Mycena olivaceomarginata]
MNVDTTLDYDEENEDEESARLTKSWRIVHQKFPGFHKLMLKNHENLPLIQSVARQMNSGMEGARSDDTGTLKPRVGLRSPPWDAILAGDLDLNSQQLPCFLFPFGQLNDVSALDTILSGPVMLRCAKMVYMGPSAALQGDGCHQGKPGNASIIGLKSFTDHVIAGLACQVRFNLPGMQNWNKNDGNFDYEEFFWNIVDLFKDAEFSAKTIALHNRVVLGHASGLAPAPRATANAAPAMSHLERLKAARVEAAQ